MAIWRVIAIGPIFFTGCAERRNSHRDAFAGFIGQYYVRSMSRGLNGIAMAIFRCYPRWAVLSRFTDSRTLKTSAFRKSVPALQWTSTFSRARLNWLQMAASGFRCPGAKQGSDSTDCTFRTSELPTGCSKTYSEFRRMRHLAVWISTAIGAPISSHLVANTKRC